MIAGTTLKAAVIANLELNNDSTTESRFRVYDNINAALRTILRTFPISQIDNCIKTTKGKLLQNISAYEWPSDFIRFIRLWIDFDNAITQTNPGYECIPAWESQFYADSLDLRPDEKKPRVDIVENGFDIRPVPSADMADGMRLKYIYLQPDISDSQQCLLRKDLQNAIEFKATSLCAKIDNYNLELSKDMNEMFMNELAIFNGDNRDI